MNDQPIVVAPPPEDALLGDAIGARALALALETGIIDHVMDGECSLRSLAQNCNLPEAGAARLVDIMVWSGALLRLAGTMVPSPALIGALEDRNRLEQKLRFLDLAARDLADELPSLLLDVPGFLARARVFGLFRYNRCLIATPADIAFTRCWVDYTSSLTRYEASVVAPFLALSGRRRLLDIGGNSGEFARILCRKNLALEATVIDLPVVTLLGQAHLAGTPESARIEFIACDARRDGLPGGHDVVSFKSVLHDWPQEEALAFLDRAAQALEPGGQLIVFERGPLDWSGGPFPYWMLANLVFAPFYRAPDIYAARLVELGFSKIEIRRIDLEMPFYILTAEKP